ncbi:MAG: translational GTPase TypA [Candidatus Binatia bacterium]
MRRDDLRNLAIIAHVDHGKTTLVDAMLRQGGIFRANETVEDRVMDSFALERERGITILAKNTSILWHGVRINIVDTPGHADFGGEVERSLAMVDGVMLLVDACEGPLPQTRFVLKKALERGLPAIVCINKIDRSDARPKEVVDEVYELFIDLDASNEQLDFPIVYTNAREGIAQLSLEEPGSDIRPLFERILSHLPGPEGDVEAPLRFQVNNLEYDDYVGRLAIGRVVAGSLGPNDAYVIFGPDGVEKPCRVTQLYGWHGLRRVAIERAAAGEIVAIAGIEDIHIGDTVADRERPAALPRLRIDEPTIAMVFSVNTSPWAGREGQWVTSRKLHERIEHERRKNVSIRIEDTGSPDAWRILGRGELALAVIVETIRREGYELAVSKPTIVLREENGARFEPMELVVVDIPEDYIGVVSQLLAVRRGRLEKLEHSPAGASGTRRARLEFAVPSRGLIGFRGQFLTDTRGNGVLNTLFNGWAPWTGPIQGRPNGAIVSDREGVATGYALFHLQERGTLFVGPGTPVYEGMVVGEYSRENNLDVNVCREKKLTNVRAAGHDEAIRLTPPHEMGLDLAIEWIDDDELVEVTPKAVRIRKRILATNVRPKIRRP